MKQRISLTLDPLVTRRIKAQARQKGISVSSWVERLLSGEIAKSGESLDPSASFSSRWRGKLRLKAGREVRRIRLRDKYAARPS